MSAKVNKRSVMSARPSVDHHQTGPDPGPSDGANRNEIAVAAKSLRLLRYILEHGAVSTTTAAHFLNVSRSTAYRILVTLRQYGFVDRDGALRLWTPGLEMGWMMSRLVD